MIHHKLARVASLAPSSYCSSTARIARVLCKRVAQKVVLAVAVAIVGAFSIIPATAAAASTGKPLPAAPKGDSQGVTAPIAEKEKAAAARSGDGTGQDAAALDYTVSLSATSTELWPLQYTTLTATANQNITPTAYYISIYDATANRYIKVCGTGTTCSESVTYLYATTHVYRAYISSYPTTNPPSSQQAVSPNVTVKWRGMSVSLAANPTTTAVSSSSLVTATASTDVGPTPFYIRIFDATTGSNIRTCGLGTTCSISVSQASATTHRYTAHIARYDGSNLQAASNASFVTWNNNGYRISLASTNLGGAHRRLTATSNKNVGITPYYIQIFNLRSNTRVAVCGTGTTCTVNLQATRNKTDFVAYVASYNTTIPPANTQASSNIVSLLYLPVH